VTRGARGTNTHGAHALLLARVAYGEADLILTFFTDSLGRISALARGARRSTKRFAGSLEPMHTLHVEVDERPSGELFALREATIDRPRLGLVSSLESLEAAGRALSWLKKAAPVRTPEPLAWAVITRFLDDLEREPARQPERLVELGMRLLDSFGWGLDLTRCVRCGKPCPLGQAALVSPDRGGLVCRACGGGPVRISGPLRAGLLRAASGEDDALPKDEVATALDLVERALAAHVGIE
jgi:DNA repair protein RecO (recombination protein O)